MQEIHFFFHKSTYRIKNQQDIIYTIQKISEDYKYQLISLNIVLTDKNILRKMNKEFLKRDYDTDIISFDLSERKRKIDGELYINVDIVRENAKKNHVTILNELCRVIFHGVLHLVGEDDDNLSNKLIMREKENKYLFFCFT
jgi:probable rRNA maturation factor